MATKVKAPVHSLYSPLNSLSVPPAGRHPFVRQSRSRAARPVGLFQRPAPPSARARPRPPSRRRSGRGHRRTDPSGTV